MALGSFVHGALADLTREDLDSMLDLDESVFVEHKRGLQLEGDAFGVHKAVAAFANTLGGWVLLGVDRGRVVGGQPPWAAGSVSLVDAVRDQLRGEIDPLPAFEARVIAHDDGSVGVIRVYESADTPHVSTRSGAVFVREVAGVRDAQSPKQSGRGAAAERAHEATKLSSRAQLLELAQRGRLAEQRVEQLIEWNLFGLQARGTAPGQLGASIVVTAIPYTLPGTFTDWAVSHDGAAAVLGTLENFMRQHGLAREWVIPNARGCSANGPLMATGVMQGPMDQQVAAQGHLELDRAGRIAAAAVFKPVEEDRWRRWMQLNDLAEAVVGPVIRAALNLLSASPAVGRARVRIDLFGLGNVLMLQQQNDQLTGEEIRVDRDTAVPPSSVDALAREASYAFARAVGLPAYTS